MRNKILPALLILIVIISASFIKRQNEAVPEYALLKISYLGLFGGSVTITFENGDTKDLKEELKLKMPGTSADNFPAEAKSFKYLNAKGFKMVSHTAFGHNNTINTYIFMKE